MGRCWPRVFLLSACFVLLGLGIAACAQANDSSVPFRFAYYPSYHKIRFFFPALPAGATAWRATLTQEGNTAVLQESQGDFPAPSGTTMEIPSLAAGAYALHVTLIVNGQPVQVSRSFLQKTLPWAQGQDHIGPEVLPPFTPLSYVDKKKLLHCVLRDYSMGNSGFWDQVTSETHPLLTAPMRLEVVSGSHHYTATGRGFNCKAQQPNQVLGHATWSAGPLTGETVVDYDIDGMMKVTMRLAPTATTIDNLALVIPMKADETWLMHPVTEYLRSHYAGRIPDGQGKVWDSSNTQHDALMGSFIPYMWVGGPERGICWFADNDKDCILDPQTPMMEIDRTTDTVNLIVHLISKPSPITRTRTIVFGLQATPAKPMPSTPANFRTWWPYGTKGNNDVNFNLMGAAYYWGAQTASNQFYPAFRNFSIYDTYAEARKTGKADPQFVDQWMAQYTGTQYSDDLKHTLRLHVQSGLNMVTGFPQDKPGATKRHWIIPYTNPRALTWDDAAQTYMDEWSIYDVADPRLGHTAPWERFDRTKAAQYNDLSGIDYAIDPVNSYIDMAMYYHKKMLTTFADGIYWDNFFLSTNSNIISGPGYIGDDGKVHPGVSIFAFRELTKRLAYMQYHMGMQPVSWIHMTNVNIVPMLSFGNINFEWEWRDQGENAVKDLQDRLDVDNDTSLILTESTGLQSGNVTVAIDRFHPPTDSGVTRDWLLRTALAVCLPHEMKVEGAYSTTAADLLEKFGYGQPDCKVYRYWEPGQPITTTGVNVRTLVLQRGKSALLVVGSFGPGGDCTAKLDLAKLGLPANVAATNYETGAAVTRSQSGTFIFPIKKHDFQLILVQ